MKNLQLAQKALKAKNFDKALILFEQLYNNNPNHLIIIKGLAQVLYQTNQFKKSKEVIMKGSEIEPKSVDLTMLSAQVAYKENEHQQAENVLLEFIKSEKSFSEPYILLSRIFVMSNKLSEAIQILEAALLTVTEKWKIHFELARILLSKNKDGEAQKHLKTALSLHLSQATLILYLHVSVYMNRIYVALISLLLLIASFMFIKTFGIWVLAFTDILILTLAVLAYIVQSKSYSFLLLGMCIFLNIIYLLFFFGG